MRFTGQRLPCEFRSAGLGFIQEQPAGQLCGGDPGGLSQFFVSINAREAGGGEGLVGLEFIADEGHSGTAAGTAADREFSPGGALGLHQIKDAISVHILPVEHQRFFRRGLAVFCVISGIQHCVVHVPIAVGIKPRDAIPPAGPFHQASRCGGLGELAVFVQEKPHGSPLAGYQQIRPAVSVGIRPERARHQA